MENKADLSAGLRSLRESLRQIKALLAWEELKQSEARPDQPLALILNDPIETDLRNEYSFFLSTSVQMHRFLDDSSGSAPAAERQKVQRQLVKIEQQLQGLNLHRRFLRS